MGKKEKWFTYVKRLFISDPKPTTQKKSKSRKRFIEKFKFKHYPAIKPPQRNLNNAAEERQKHAMAMAIATKAAAEAAVAAANAAAEVVRLTNMAYEFERKNLNLAATKIQAFYRGHLARKALRAFKGVVKLQAVVRGDLVRRNIINELLLYSAFLDQDPTAKQEIVEDLNPPLTLLPRRSSFSRVKKKAVGHDETLRVFPSYMAATESTKAKLRSPNTSKQRTRLSDVCCSQDSPSKLSLSSWSSINSERIKTNKTTNLSQ